VYRSVYIHTYMAHRSFFITRCVYTHTHTRTHTHTHTHTPHGSFSIAHFTYVKPMLAFSRQKCNTQERFHKQTHTHRSTTNLHTKLHTKFTHAQKVFANTKLSRGLNLRTHTRTQVHYQQRSLSISIYIYTYIVLYPSPNTNLYV